MTDGAFDSWQTISMSFLQGCIHVIPNFEGDGTEREVVLTVHPTDVKPVG